MAKKTANTSLPRRSRQAKAGAAKKLTVTLVRSPIGFDRTQGETVTGLGLRRIRHSVDLPDTPETRGMIHKVRHLVVVKA